MIRVLCFALALALASTGALAKEQRKVRRSSRSSLRRSIIPNSATRLSATGRSTRPVICTSPFRRWATRDTSSWSVCTKR